jgi:ParB-like chromosome segregation protein Spo0J
LIFVQENELIWLIDGHHRLRALAQLGQKTFAAYVIEEKDSARYKIFWNGERISPWMKEEGDR